jgi:hypothetical protein
MLIRKLEKNIKTAQGFNPIFLQKNSLFFFIQVGSQQNCLNPYTHVISQVFFSYIITSNLTRKESCRNDAAFLFCLLIASLFETGPMPTPTK